LQIVCGVQVVNVPCKSVSSCTYTIQAGDTFWAIANSRGTTVDVIQALNPGVSPTSLQIGQVRQMRVHSNACSAACTAWGLKEAATASAKRYWCLLRDLQVIKVPC
jgi:LysM repeat protein